MSKYAHELHTAEQLARRAGAAILPMYGKASADPGTADAPVTAADRAANRIIVEGLGSAFPGDPILSEESTDSVERLASERVWIVDPLDGTKEFLAQNGEFAVMIGLAVGGRAVVGAVYLPATDALYAASDGAGAFVERAGKRRPLRRTRFAGPGIRLVGSRSHPDPLVVRMAEALAITDVEPCGSVGVKCARIAENRRDLYVHPVPYLKEWDTCAPEVVAREAGCHVSDCEGNALDYNKRDPRQPHGLLACAPEFSARVLPVVVQTYRHEG